MLNGQNPASTEPGTVHTAKVTQKLVDDARRSGDRDRLRSAEETNRSIQESVKQYIGRFPELADEDLMKRLAPTKWERVMRWLQPRRSS